MTLLRFILFVLLLACDFSFLSAGDTAYIKVHFLYGSVPRREFRSTETRWFGGKPGGHVGIEVDSNRIVDFVPEGQFHWIGHKKNRHSHFAVHTIEGFWSIFGSPPDSVKKTTIVIPVTAKQKQKLDSLCTAYRDSTPYDYAFAGMRCAAAAHDILAHTGVLPACTRPGVCLRSFYPKRLRKRLLNLAQRERWQVLRQEGSVRRKWEKD